MGAGKPIEWIRCDESGREMVSRVLSGRPFIVPVPPLHRVPLRLGNIVEISGPSNSAKSQVLLQAVVHFILPKEWGGIQFGGLERKAVFFDLDCRFDVLRLSQFLTNRINETCGSISKAAFDKLFHSCMNRFLYVRCYSSYEFLSSLKELCYQIQRKDEAVGSGVHLLLIDSIGAFHWIDRSNQLRGVCKGKNISPQSFQEAIVHELHKLLLLQPLLVLATKASLFRTETPNEFQRSSISNISGERNLFFREYMPAVWQSFVTHRIQLHSPEWNLLDIVDDCACV
ncbi:DNA repair protein XRCC2 isoform X3 [Carex littledalei]|uniref:DNA repair protein XRCC2 isoform X3 n=1 Tax=Carex littledalei TaxID=544730 RepID=A0A833R919_9POAL|nr:DNA repair protein XRCC2 isoform X3 [Carex littledalei]